MGGGPHRCSQRRGLCGARAYSRRGGDILKAIALGADVVAPGRLQGWGLAAGGQAGLARMLEILEDELVSAMGLTGLTSMDRVTPKYVCQADPVTDAHEMSSWVN